MLWFSFTLALKFVFLWFWVTYDNEFETKENKN